VAGNLSRGINCGSVGVLVKKKVLGGSWTLLSVLLGATTRDKSSEDFGKGRRRCGIGGKPGGEEMISRVTNLKAALC